MVYVDHCQMMVSKVVLILPCLGLDLENLFGILWFQKMSIPHSPPWRFFFFPVWPPTTICLFETLPPLKISVGDGLWVFSGVTHSVKSKLPGCKPAILDKDLNQEHPQQSQTGVQKNTNLGPVVQWMDSSIHKINHNSISSGGSYQAESCSSKG